MRHLCIVLLLLAPATLTAQGPPLRIGMSLDGPWERNSEISRLFKDEITALLGREREVLFPADKQLQADWSAAAVRANLQLLWDDPEVDVVLALGVLSSNEAGRRPSLPKTTLAPYILAPEIQGVPYVERRGRTPGLAAERIFHVSGVSNLSYTAVGTDFRREVEELLRIVQFERLTVLQMEALRDGIPEIRDRLRDEIQPLGVEVSVVAVGKDVNAALDAIPAGAQAVYVTPLLQLPAGGIETLAQGLIERRLPSFSLWGRTEVQKGLLAGLALDRDFTRTARRTALNLHRIVLGEAASEIPVDFKQTERLTFNVSTARAIGVRRTWKILTEAELISQPRETADRMLSLAGVVREAENANLDLRAADRTVAAGVQLVREARAPLRPQLDVTGRETIIDRDRAVSSFGSQGQSQVSGSLGFTQLLYSEPARAGYAIEKELQLSREGQRAELRLDVVLEAAQAYLDVLRAKTGERIQRDNLELTRSNLESARTRLELGAAGPGEVYRWEAQIAGNRSDLIAAAATRNQAEIQLNRVLNRPLEEPFITQEIGVDDAELSKSYEALRDYVDNQEGFGIFRAFMAKEGLEAAPELRQIDAAVRAQERALLASKRVFYRPTVAFQADATGFRNDGPGSTSPFADASMGGAGGLEFPALPNSLNWSLALNATLPLFQGGELRARRDRAAIELDELTLQREAIRLRVEQRVRSQMHQTMASWAAIDLSREAAEAAGKNLELVADAYGEGVVDILRLLDAQNQKLVADLVAANAVYNYLRDLMAVERSVGHFDYFRSAADRDDFLQRLDTHFKEAGYALLP